MSEFLLQTEKLPRRSQRVALRILGWAGWKVRFAPLPGPRGVMIVYPHTSNWDFPIGVLAKWAVGVPIRWLAKDSLFTGIGGFFFGRLFRYWGGEPIERKAATGAIDRIAEHMRSADHFWLALTPEGTRGYRPYWRSGFYHIALAAQVPIAIAYIDYATRVLGVVDHFIPTGDVERDMDFIRNAFAGKQGYRQEWAGAITLQPPEK